MKPKNELLAAIKVITDAGYEVTPPPGEHCWDIYPGDGYEAVYCPEPPRDDEFEKIVTIGDVTGIYEDYDYISSYILINTNVSEETN